MKKTTIITGLTALLLASLAGLPNAEAGMVKVINNSTFVLGVGITYSDGNKSGPDIINPNSSRPGLGSPVKTVTRIRVVNTTSGTNPDKAVLKDYQESAPHLLKDYIVTVDNQGGIAISETKPAGIL